MADAQDKTISRPAETSPDCQHFSLEASEWRGQLEENNDLQINQQGTKGYSRLVPFQTLSQWVR